MVKQQSDNVAIAKVKIPKSINRSYIYWLLKSHIFQSYIRSLQRTAQNGFNKTDLGNLPIPLPPLAEQNRIVEKLDKLFGHLDVLKERLAKIPQLLEDFRQSVLSQAVSGELTAAWREGKELGEFDVFQNCEKDHWNQKALLKFNEALLSTSFNNIEPSHWIKTNPGIICKKIVDGTHKTPKYQTDGVQFLSAKNVRNWKLDKSGCKYISLRCNPEKGTLLLTKSGTIGRMVVLEETPNFSLFESVAILTPSSKKIQVKFIGYSIKVYLEGGGSQKHVKGVAVQHLHLNEIRTLPIKLPPPKEQKEIVRRVESLFAKADKIDQSYTALKEKIDHLPQALLAKAFRGELVPQLPGDGDARDLLEEIRKVREEMSGKVKKGKGKPK